MFLELSHFQKLPLLIRVTTLFLKKQTDMKQNHKSQKMDYQQALLVFESLLSEQKIEKGKELLESDFFTELYINFSKSYSNALKHKFKDCPVDDLIQDGFVKLIEKMVPLDHIGKLSGWLYKTITNLCYDYLRKKEMVKSTDTHFSCYQAVMSEESFFLETADWQLLWKHEQLPFETAMQKLKIDFPRDWEILYLRVYINLSHHEIAQQLSITEQNSRKRCSLAKIFLRDTINSLVEEKH